MTNNNKPRTDLTKEKHWFLYALMVGVICVLISTILDRGDIPLSAIGYLIIAPAIVGYLFTIFLERVSLGQMELIFKERMDKLTEDFQKLKVGMEDNINVIEGAVNSDIINIYANREQALKDMATKIEGSNKHMFLLAVSGTDFFTLNGALTKQFEKKFLSPRSFEDEEETVRVLLIDPFSQAAKERAEIEQPLTNYYNSDIKSDTFKAIQRIKELKEKKAKIDAHFYSHTPILFVLRVDDYMFIEPYHLGYVETAGTLGCIGKQVPLFLVTSKSSMFERLCKHFENIWEDYSESFEDILKVKDWLRAKGREDSIIKEKLPQYPDRKGKYEVVLALIKKEESKEDRE